VNVVIHTQILSIGLLYNMVTSFGQIFVIGLHNNNRERLPVSNIERQFVLNCSSGEQSFHIMGAVSSGSLS
jgi:hypothetical protein